MAKICMPEKVESKSTSLQMQHINNKSKCSENNDSCFDSLDDMIDRVQSIQIFKNNRFCSDINAESQNNEPVLTSNVVNKNNIAFDDEKPDKLSDVDDEDDKSGLIESDPLRAQVYSDRSTSYTDKIYWSTYSIIQQSDNSTDFDTSAKKILTDSEHRKKIDICLNELSNMNQEQSITNSFLSTYSHSIGPAGYLQPPQQQQQQYQSNGSPDDLHTKHSCYVPSITVYDSETSLLKILSRGGFQPAQFFSTPEHKRIESVISSTRTYNWLDFPVSSNDACASSSSRSNSRASSRVQSPNCSNGCDGASLHNALNSPMESPQVSPQNFQNLQRQYSSSSSSKSFYETPSPANYQNYQLDDNVMARFPVYHDNFKYSDTLIETINSNELQLQLIEEVIRSDMNSYIKDHMTTDPDLQVVPTCKSISSSNCSNIYSIINTNSILSSEISSYIDNSEITDDLTNTLLRFVRGEQTIVSPKKLETRSSSTTSGYSSCCSSSNNSSTWSSSSSNSSSSRSSSSSSSSSSSYISSSSKAGKTCDGSFLQIEQMSNYLEILKTQTSQLPQQQTAYQQYCTNSNSRINIEDIQFNTTTVNFNGSDTWQSYSEPNSLMVTSASSSNFSHNQIPETFLPYSSQITESSSKCSSNNGSNGKRNIAPWPSLNLPSTRASERLKEVTDPLEVEKAMKNLLKRPLDELTKRDEDGDTMLMCLVGNPLELRKKLAYLVPLVERLGTIKGALSSLNLRGEDALYLAAINCPQMSFVAGYLGAASLQKNIDIGQSLYCSRGDTLIHALAAKGDGHGEVLAELLSLKTLQGNPVFDLSKRNYDGRTALHIAAESHYSMKKNTQIVSVGTIRLLLENGADPMIRDVACGNTALHLAISSNCDPSVVKVLLTGRGQQAINAVNYNGNTPLHAAAISSEQTNLEYQLEIWCVLIQAGGRTNVTNRQGKTPLALVSADRKEALRRIFNKKI